VVKEREIATREVRFWALRICGGRNGGVWGGGGRAGKVGVA